MSALLPLSHHSDSSPAGALVLAASSSIGPITPTLPSEAGGSFVSFDGATISGTISGLTAHTWIDGANGLFETASNLSAEWTGYYQQMIEGHSASLTPTQRLEAQADAMSLFTGLGTLSTTLQNTVREDVQREIDVIGAAQTIDQSTLGINPAAPLTAQTYLDIVQTIQANPTLEELGVQGHGLNNPPLARYNGYTNDAQHTADTSTYYVGTGGDKNELAVTSFMDDAIMTHMIFPVVMKQGRLVQLNQDGDKEETLVNAVRLADRTMYGPLLAAKDFSTTKANP
jgi:hypothetical protein